MDLITDLYTNISSSSSSFGYMDDVTKRVDGRYRVEEIYLDFQVFDSVSHRLQLGKWIHLNFPKMWSGGSWDAQLQSYPNYALDVKSSEWQMHSKCTNVPHGSAVEPLLFLLYVDDLGRDLLSHCLKLADSLETVSTANQETMQADPNRVY